MSEGNSDGIGFMGLLQLLFIALKLMGYITWNWFYVLLPFESILGVLAIGGLFALYIAIEDAIDERKMNKEMNNKKKNNEI